MAKVKFYRGVAAKQSQSGVDGIYFSTDIGVIYTGDKAYGKYDQGNGILISNPDSSLAKIISVNLGYTTSGANYAVKNDNGLYVNVPAVNIGTGTVNKLAAWGTLGTTSTLKDSIYQPSTTLTSSSDTELPTSKAIAAYVDTFAANAMHYKGTTADWAAGSSEQGKLTPEASVGDVYAVTSDGSIMGVKCETGDMFICKTTTVVATSATVPTVLANWDIVNANWSVSNAGETIGTTAKTIATVGGVAITAKIADYILTSTYNTHTHGTFKLNGTAQTSTTPGGTASTPSFYAPTTVPSADGSILIGHTTGAPTWADTPDISVGKATVAYKLGDTTIDVTGPISLVKGVPTTMTNVPFYTGATNSNKLAKFTNNNTIQGGYDVSISTANVCAADDDTDIPTCGLVAKSITTAVQNSAAKDGKFTLKIGTTTVGDTFTANTATDTTYTIPLATTSGTTATIGVVNPSVGAGVWGAAPDNAGTNNKWLDVSIIEGRIRSYNSWTDTTYSFTNGTRSPDTSANETITDVTLSTSGTTITLNTKKANTDTAVLADFTASPANVVVTATDTIASAISKHESELTWIDVA